MASKPAQIRIGVGGWTFPPWRGPFYPKGLPQKRELEYASRKFSSIEVNGTFYGSIKRESFVKWREETPDDFVFALKAPRFATNRRVLAEAGPSIERFFDGGVLDLGEKLGPVNWQFAPTKKFDAGDFEAFLALLPKKIDGRVLRHAVEVRHESFRCAEFVALARRHSVAIVAAGDSKYPAIPDSTTDFIYARIMGTSDTRASGYSAPTLKLWAERARDWSRGEAPKGIEPVGPACAKRKRDVFLYVIAGHKERNPAAAMALTKLLEKAPK